SCRGTRLHTSPARGAPAAAHRDRAAASHGSRVPGLARDRAPAHRRHHRAAYAVLVGTAINTTEKAAALPFSEHFCGGQDVAVQQECVVKLVSLVSAMLVAGVIGLPQVADARGGHFGGGHFGGGHFGGGHFGGAHFGGFHGFRGVHVGGFRGFHFGGRR